MKRPIITEFLGDGIELEEAHEIYKMNPELWSYIQAQDKHIDYVESQLEKESKQYNTLFGIVNGFTMNGNDPIEEYDNGYNQALENLGDLLQEFLTSNPK